MWFTFFDCPCLPFIVFPVAFYHSKHIETWTEHVPDWYSWRLSLCNLAETTRTWQTERYWPGSRFAIFPSLSFKFAEWTHLPHLSWSWICTWWQVLLERCILSPRNKDVRSINEAILASFRGPVCKLWSVDKALDLEDHSHVDILQTPENLHAMTPSDYPLAHLKLKIGCPVIVLWNLQPKQGIVNGMCGIVTRISRWVLELHLQLGSHVLIPHVKLISIDEHIPFHLQHLQFPVAVTFTMTINKAQGQSFDTVGIDLRNAAFTHGQLYVTLSRARSSHGIKCLIDSCNNDHCTPNIVFKEVIV